MLQCKKYKKTIGKFGDKVAGKYLEKLDYKIIYKNFRCKCGEIDIVAIKNHEIIFVEVKTRTNFKYGLPSESVNRQKQEHICKTAKYFLYSNDLIDTCVRFDVIEVVFINKKCRIRHLKDVFVG